MVNTRAFAILGILLALGLALFGYQVGEAVRIGRSFDRYLSVKGLAEREVEATLVVWPIRYSADAEELPALKQEIERTKSLVLAYLSEKGITSDEISIALPEISDRLDNARWHDSTLAVPRYGADLALVVHSGHISLVKEALAHFDSLMEAGVKFEANRYDTSVESTELFDRLNDVKPEMIAEATANARKVAETFAHDSKAKVGAIRKASQGVFDIRSRDVARPERMTIRVVSSVEFFLE